MDNAERLQELLDRLARVNASEEWGGGLNPAQRSALAYIARANQFSRAPSNVADYLCTTRGTASQTLKALERKGLISRARSATDKRTISYDLTDSGRDVLNGVSDLASVIRTLPPTQASSLIMALETLTHKALKRRGFRSFGVCKTCRYHRNEKAGPRCDLLELDLDKQAINEICHEHEAPHH